MAWIDTVDEGDATGALREIYDEIAESRGKVANILKAHSLNPEALEAHSDLYRTLLFGRSPLRRATREALAVVVSAANGCDYCVRHHAEALDAYWNDRERVRTLATDRSALDLDPKLAAACDHAERLTTDPDAASEADVEALRRAGWEDRAILDITLVTAYFNFVNRIANGLGVAFTEDEATGYDY